MQQEEEKQNREWEELLCVGRAAGGGDKQGMGGVLLLCVGHAAGGGAKQGVR